MQSIDAELVTRLGNIAAANMLVRGGQDHEQLTLAINLHAERSSPTDRPTMQFRFALTRVGADHWLLDAGIDAPAASRFAA